MTQEDKEALKEAYANPPWRTQSWVTLEWIGDRMGYRIGVRGLNRTARDRVFVALAKARVPCKEWCQSLVWREEAVLAMLAERSKPKEVEVGN